MNYVQNKTQLDALARKLSEHLKIPATRVRSAIAKAEGFEHISALVTALTENTQPDAANSGKRARSYAMEQFVWWLKDNVDMGSDIHFDNEGEIGSPEVLSEIEYLEGNSVDLQYLMVEFDSWLLAQTSNPIPFTNSRKKSMGYRSDSEFLKGTESAITEAVMSLASTPQLTKALAVLQAHGLKDVTDKLIELTTDGFVLKNLN
tara:strand:+ start:1219 stop:1830 length:612 start_codon:yes stop_codon:yes gene_type:complete